MMRLSSATSRIRGSSLVEVIVSTGATAVLAVSMLVGIVTLQRSFRAAQYYAKSQIEQARMIDYIARDLRRGLAVEVDTFEGASRLNVQIPDYYGPDGNPRDPVIDRGTAIYGDPAHPVTIRYYKSGASLIREVAGTASALATDVDDFDLQFTDSGKQTVSVSISFVPKFQINARDVSTLRLGTTSYATTLLRNKRAN